MAAALANVLLGLGGIGAGIGFGVKERQLMNELNEKADKLKKDVEEVGDIYDHVYYLVCINAKRFLKSVDKLPIDFIKKVQKDIEADLKSSKLNQTLSVLAQVIGYSTVTLAITGGILEIVRRCKSRSTASKPKGRESDPWGDIELTPRGTTKTTPGEPTEPTPSVELTSVSRTPTLDKWIKGLNIAGAVFGVAGLAATIGLGVWDIEKLKKAIDDVDKKQKEVTAFQNAMVKVLDETITAAGLPAKSYDELKTLAATWKEMAENFERYTTRMEYAIKGYFQRKPLDDVKKMVNNHTEPTDKPWPEDGYPLAETLADDIRVLFDKGKTDQQVIQFFATDNPKEGLRFVFDGFFIGSMRDVYDMLKP